MKNLGTLIDQYLGKKKVINLTFLEESEYEYQKRNNQCVGYNQAIQDLKSRKQELIEGIVRLAQEKLNEIIDNGIELEVKATTLIKELTGE